MPMEDLVQYQAPESLASFHVQAAVNDLVTWAFPLAQRVQIDVATLVTAKTQDATARASAQLRKDQLALDAQRARIDQLINTASTSLAAHVAPPSLPS
jgi:monoamine oxidase